MTIEKAIQELLISEKFMKDARHDAKLRVFKQRYKEGKVKNGAAISLLLAYGYKINVTEK